MADLQNNLEIEILHSRCDGGETENGWAESQLHHHIDPYSGKRRSLTCYLEHGSVINDVYETQSGRYRDPEHDELRPSL